MQRVSMTVGAWNEQQSLPRCRFLRAARATPGCHPVPQAFLKPYGRLTWPFPNVVTAQGRQPRRIRPWRNWEAPEHVLTPLLPAEVTSTALSRDPDRNSMGYPPGAASVSFHHPRWIQVRTRHNQNLSRTATQQPRVPHATCTKFATVTACRPQNV